ncbi:hypothetical protein [Lysinibacillus sp. PWR01]
MWKCTEVTYYFLLVSVLYVDKKIVPQVYLGTPNDKKRRATTRRFSLS